MSKRKKKSLNLNSTTVQSQIEQAICAKISVNPQDVINHLDFLHNIDARGKDKFYNENFVQNSIRRYEKLWLPLITALSDNFDDDLQYAPPLGMYFEFQSFHVIGSCHFKIKFQTFIGFGMFIC